MKQRTLQRIDSAVEHAQQGALLLRRELKLDPQARPAVDAETVRNGAARFGDVVNDLSALQSLVDNLAPVADRSWARFSTQYTKRMDRATRNLIDARDVLRQAHPEHELGELQWWDIENLAGDSIGDAHHLPYWRDTDRERFESVKEIDSRHIATALQNARDAAALFAT